MSYYASQKFIAVESRFNIVFNCAGSYNSDLLSPVTYMFYTCAYKINCLAITCKYAVVKYNVNALSKAVNDLKSSVRT